MMNPATKSSVHLSVDDADAAWARATAAGATVVMPIADMFWGNRYGVLSDSWGNRWSDRDPPGRTPRPLTCARAWARRSKNMPKP